MAETPLIVTPELTIPPGELSVRFSRAGGPGGQHVNTSSTRVELAWNVAASPSLTDAQRARLLERLANRISADGILSVAASSSRSQHRNREEAAVRLAGLVRDALRESKARRPTRPTRAARERRLKAKKRRSEVKRQRSSPPTD